MLNKIKVQKIIPKFLKLFMSRLGENHLISHKINLVFAKVTI